jgi:hypothetical protein
MHYKPTLPRPAKIAVFFNILFLQIIITGVLMPMPGFAVAGVIAASIGVAITPLLKMIFVLSTCKSMRTCK